MALKPKRLILDLLSSGERIPVRVLVQAGGLFDINENRLRVALARLANEGMVEVAERGVYRLGARADAVNRHVAGWRDLEERTRPWRDGAWVGVHLGAVALGDRAATRRRTRAFEMLGLATLSPGLVVRPDNLVGGVEAVRARLTELADPLPVFELGGLDSETERTARGLWDTAALDRAYVTLRRGLEESLRDLERMPLDRALCESFLRGGDVIRQLAFDPLLPAPLVRVDARRALVDAMRAYDDRGRAIWRACLQSLEAA